MAYIQKREAQDGKSRYRVQIRKKGYPIQTATFPRLTDARKWARDTESAIDDGRYFKTSEAKRHTLSELVDRYVLHVLPTKPKSQKKQTQQLGWWKDQIGDYALAAVTPALIAEYRDRLAQTVNVRGSKNSPSTVLRYLAALSHAFTVAVNEWGWLDDNPLRKVTKPTEPRGRVRFLSDDERERLLTACRTSSNLYLYPVVVLALSTGMRQGEILGLIWDDIDIHQGRITLHDTKNNERRVVPLASHAMEIMREHMKVRRLDTEFVFPSKVGRGRNPMDLRAPWNAALKKAQIEDFRFHDLRHSAASYLAMNGVSLAELAEVLGHKTLQMVKRYAHLSEAHTTGVVTRMNEKIFG